MKKYEQPDLEIITLLKHDIVTLSLDIGGGDDVEGDWNS